MKLRFLFFILICALTFPSNTLFSKEIKAETLLKGGWGKNLNEIGINFPSPGVMPLAPFTCIGGLDIFNKEDIWISDSINQSLKFFKNGKLISNFKIESSMCGELAVNDNSVFLVINGDKKGIQILDKKTGTSNRFVPIPFKNPGRISILATDSFVVEESGNGIWFYKNGVTQKHPSGALEAISTGTTLYGTQFNLAENNRLIISCDLSVRLEQPEMYYLFEVSPELRILYSKLCGFFDGNPVLTSIDSGNPNFYSAYLLDKNSGNLKHQGLPILTGPFLSNAWKIRDGYFFTFTGNPKAGWKVIRIPANFIN